MEKRLYLSATDKKLAGVRWGSWILWTWFNISQNWMGNFDCFYRIGATLIYNLCINNTKAAMITIKRKI